MGQSKVNIAAVFGQYLNRANYMYIYLEMYDVYVNDMLTHKLNHVPILMKLSKNGRIFMSVISDSIKYITAYSVKKKRRINIMGSVASSS